MTGRPLTPVHSASSTSAVRCRDLWAWERAVAGADLGRPKYVSKRTVLAVANALRRYMHGPKHSDTGAGARPGSERLAAEIGLGRVAVERALSELVANGLLVREVNACPGRRAVYAAALPICGQPADHVSPATHDPAERVSPAIHNHAERVSPATHRPTEVKTTTATRGEPVQLPIVASIDGGGGQPPAESNPGPTLQAVAAALPAQLAGELLHDPDVDELDQALEHLAEQLDVATIVNVCTRRLPADLGSITALLRADNGRIAQLQRRAAGAVARIDDRRADRLDGARRFGDTHAMNGGDRSGLLSALTYAYPDDPDAQTAALQAFTTTRAAIDQEATG